MSLPLPAPFGAASPFPVVLLSLIARVTMTCKEVFLLATPDSIALLSYRPVLWFVNFLSAFILG